MLAGAALIRRLDRGWRPCFQEAASHGCGQETPVHLTGLRQYPSDSHTASPPQDLTGPMGQPCLASEETAPEGEYWGGGRIAEGAWQIREAACQMPPPVSFLLCKTGTLSRLPERSGAPNKRRREKPGPYSEQPKGGPIAPTNAGGPNPPSRNPADRPGPRRAPPLGEWEPVTGRTLPPPALLFLKGFKHLIYSIH